jgi:diguanylate cyclase
MASRIIIALSTPYPVAGTVVRIGVSVGLSDVAADHGDLTQSMLSADQALYRAKASGKGRFVSAEDMPIGLAGTA